MAVQGHEVKAVDTTNIDRLGFFLDGWADLIEGMGNKTTEVKSEVYKQLTSRDMPEIKIKNTQGRAGDLLALLEPKRDFTLTATNPGATTAVYVGEHGKDLYVSWKTFIRRIPNWKILGVLAVIAGSFGVCCGLPTLLSSYQAVNSAQGLINVSGIITFGLILAACSFFFMIVSILATEIIFLAVAGTIIFRDPLYFLTVHPTIFDADDIAAMSLSAHKSLLNALDKVGINTTLLKPKQQFKGATQTQTL